jgi:DNA-binding HxlR family transcriptional regulator
MERKREAASVGWDEVVDSVAASAIESVFQTAHARKILGLLTVSGEDGISFKELKAKLKMSASSLNNSLTELQQGGIIENFLERRAQSREFSFYRATPLGRIATSEIDSLFHVMDRRIVEHSKVPEVSHLLLTSLLPESLSAIWGNIHTVPLGKPILNLGVLPEVEPRVMIGRKLRYGRGFYAPAYCQEDFENLRAGSSTPTLASPV